jgi:hypothetical protein
MGDKTQRALLCKFKPYHTVFCSYIVSVVSCTNQILSTPRLSFSSSSFYYYQIQELNKLFIEYMHELGNEGRVEIEENPASLSQWGLILSVSFRKGTAPVPLKKNVQSGGERSVSTIMFLMALQDMVKSPFRVVDEINQGMDERNERIVFKRIVERSVGPNRPQYFLITPKLLQVLLSYIYR